MAKVSEMNRNNKVISSLILTSSLFLAACGGSSSNNGLATRLTEEDFNNQSFVVKGNEQVADSFTFFNKNKTGTEFIGDFKDKPFSVNPMTWDIKDNESLNVAFNGGSGGYSFFREVVEKNIYTGRKNGKPSYLRKLLPLKLQDLDGKIFKFDLSGLASADNPRGCISRTLKVVKNKAYLKEVCNKDTPKNILVHENVAMHSEFSNTVKFSFLAPNNKDSILLSLISGDFNTSAEVVLVYQGRFKAVQIEKMKMVKKEAF